MPDARVHVNMVTTYADSYYRAWHRAFAALKDLEQYEMDRQDATALRAEVLRLTDGDDE